MVGITKRRSENEEKTRKVPGSKTWASHFAQKNTETKFTAAKPRHFVKAFIDSRRQRAGLIGRMRMISEPRAAPGDQDRNAVFPR
jgi:hypothetical protein